MKITKFKFTNYQEDWTLNETLFSEFNLLLGVSGSGKTRILHALQTVCEVGLSTEEPLSNCEWALELIAQGKTFYWSAKTSTITQDTSTTYLNFIDDKKQTTNPPPHFVHEQIICDDKTILVNRVVDKFVFKGTELPKLKNTESAITLLSDEDTITPLYRALCRVIFSLATNTLLDLMPYDSFSLYRIKERYPNWESLHQAIDVPPLVKACIFYQDYPKQFEKIKDAYLAIFEEVEDLKVGTEDELNPAKATLGTMDWLTIAVKEKGVKNWLNQDKLSAGMLRTLILLIEWTLAPPGSVIVIDEFEKSLGVNCLPQLTEYLLSRAGELQLIISSHHPYVIKSTPAKHWKFVTRSNSTVTVLNKETILATKNASDKDMVIQLINLKNYAADSKLNN